MDLSFVEAARQRLVGHKFSTKRQIIQIAQVMPGPLPGTESVSFRIFGLMPTYRVSLLFVVDAIADGDWIQVR